MQMSLRSIGVISPEGDMVDRFEAMTIKDEEQEQ